jgi:hypothetical protein
MIIKDLYTERGKTGIFHSQKPGRVVFQVCIVKDRPVRIRNEGTKNRILSMGGV